MEERAKREVPLGLKKILDLDIKLSKDLVETVNQRYPIATYRCSEILGYTYLILTQDSFEVPGDIVSWNTLVDVGNRGHLRDQFERSRGEPVARPRP